MRCADEELVDQNAAVLAVILELDDVVVSEEAEEYARVRRFPQAIRYPSALL
jgi:hypothetical protein